MMVDTAFFVLQNYPSAGVRVAVSLLSPKQRFAKICRYTIGCP